MLTRKQLKDCVRKMGNHTTYFMFFEIIRDDSIDYCFTSSSLTEEEMKELEPIKILTKRTAKKFFKLQFSSKELETFETEINAVIEQLFPTTLYQSKYSKQYYFVYPGCQDFLENRKLIKGIPTVKINLKEFNEK